MSQAQAQDDDDDDEDTPKEECQWNCEAGEEGPFCWGTDVDKAKEKHVLYTDAHDMKNYVAAVAPLEWLLENRPNLNESIYIHAIKIYRDLAKKESDAAKKKEYQDKHLAAYDKRIEYFCDEIKNRQYQAQYAFGYLIKRAKEDKALYEKLYNMYDNVYSLAGHKTKRTNLTYYMQMTKIMYQLKKIDEDKVLENYDNIIEVIDENIEKHKGDSNKKAKWEKASEAVNALLETTLPIDCEFVKSKWGEKITVDKSLKLAQKAVRFMIKDKCTDDPLFLTALEMVNDQAPTTGTTKVLYKKYLAEDNLEKATTYMEQALELARAEESLEDQSEILEDRGDLKRKDGQLSEARKDYMKAIELDMSRSSDIYSKIGYMYMASFKSCLASGGDPIKDKAVYFAAYDMFAKAKDNAGMAKARSAFPTKQDVFLYANKGHKEGGSIAIGCWIGGSSTVRVR